MDTALMRTFRHRLGNDFSLLHSLLGLSLRRVADEPCRRVLEANRARIRVLALIHDVAWSSGAQRGRLGAGHLIRQIAKKEAQGHAARLLLGEQNPAVSLDQAIPLGLLAHELIANSLEHAFPEATAAELRVEVSRASDRHVSLLVADNGVGVPADFDASKQDGLGLKIAHLLAEQLLGRLAARNRTPAGLEVSVVFPVD